MENAEEIAAVEGIDTLFLGTDDLKIRIGMPIDTPVLKSGPLVSALARVAQAAREAGKSAGCIAFGEELFRQSVDLGYQLVVGGCDKAFIHDCTRERIQSLRIVLGENA